MITPHGHVAKQIKIENHRIIELGQKEPDRPRFRVKEGNFWRTITWGQMLDNTAKVTHYFLDIGVGLNTKIAIYARNQVEWACLDAAIRFVKAVFVPVYTSNTAKQAQYIIDHSDAELVITDLEHLSVLLGIVHELPMVKRVIVVDCDGEDGCEESIASCEKKIGFSFQTANCDILTLHGIYQRYNKQLSKSLSMLHDLVDRLHPFDIAAIVYTSGTTGRPKGVVLTRYNLFVNANDWIDVLGGFLPSTRVDLLWLPMSHIFGWGELGLGNTLRFETYLTSHTEVLADMVNVKPTVFMSVPAYWEKLYQQARVASDKKTEQIAKLLELTGGRLQFCLSGGAGLKRKVKEFFLEAGLFIIEGYGLTECSPTLTMNKKGDFDFDTVGKPFPTVQVKLAGDGEILAKGPNIFKGYYRNPEATNAAFDGDGWLKTGDLGEFTAKGFLKIRGRKKEIIVTSGGKNIAPQVIEAHFKEDPYIEHIVLYGNEKKYLTAFLTLKQENIQDYGVGMGILVQDPALLHQNIDVLDLIQKRVDEVNTKLASYETIKKYYIYNKSLTVEEGFLTPSLKLRRNMIHRAFRKELDALYE